jgi:DNA repair photolyase
LPPARHHGGGEGGTHYNEQSLNIAISQSRSSGGKTNGCENSHRRTPQRHMPVNQNKHMQATLVNPQAGSANNISVANNLVEDALNGAQVMPEKPGTGPLLGAWSTPPVGMWPHHAVISENNFIFKSLSSWALNTAVGCEHACRFCYVPSTSTIKLTPELNELGVEDPDAEWGQYVFLRSWDEAKFLASLRHAEQTPADKLKSDGNRAVLLCSTTDPYQVIKHPDPKRAKELRDHAAFVVRRALELIRDRSTINVRILTRSPLAKRDFDLFKSLGKRLLFGMSLPTLDNNLARIYEPKAPAPSQRLATLQAAAAAGIPVFVALAPTPAEVDEADLRATLTEVKRLKPLTIFSEPINMRAENVERIEAHARSLGVKLNTAVFASRETWRAYSVAQLKMVERVAGEVGLRRQLHLWPDN